MSTQQNKNYVEISKAIKDGATSIKEIHEKTGFSYLDISLYSSQFCIDLPGQIGARQLENIVKIERAIADGANSVEAISRQTNIKEKTIKKYASNSGIELPTKKYKRREERLAKIRQAIADGAKSIEDLSEKIGLAYTSIRRYASKAGIELPKLKRGRKPICDSNRNRLIKRGLSLGELAKVFHVERQAMEDYIKRREELYSTWKQSRSYYQQAKKWELKTAQANLIKTFYSIIGKNLKAEDRWAYEKAMKYRNEMNFVRASLTSLFMLFKRYEQAKNDGKKLSLEDLCTGLDGISFTHVGRILNSVGEAPLYGKREVKRPNKETIERIKRAIPIRMTTTDIAYLMGDTNQHTVYQNMKRYDKNGIRKRLDIPKYITSVGRGKKLTNTIASQIYEAQDVGFTREEIIELLGSSKKVVDYAIQYKDKISANIILALKTIHQDKDITSPYRDFRV